MDKDKDYKLEKRKYVLGAGAVLVVLVYLVRLFFLQLEGGALYVQKADNNAFLHRVLFPARGSITDRKGKLLVYNQPAYDIVVVMNEQRGVDTVALCRCLGIDSAWYNRRMAEIKDKQHRNPGYSPYTEQVFMSQLSGEEVSDFQEKLFRFPGFYVQKRSIRQYMSPHAAHILGDVGEVGPKDIEEDAYYRSGDYIGKLGVERGYEKELRGEKGVEILLRDARGRIKGKYQDGKFDKAPVPGRNLTLSIDHDLQALGERLMRGKLGSIVAIEPKTGEVLCMVSSPTYDPRSMVGRQRGQNNRVLSQDPMKPLLNRAITGTFPPGSTFKTTQGLTFLQEGIISPMGTAYPCSHGFHLGRLTVGCHGHAAPLPLVPAIATSCNGYFCWGLYYMLGNTKKYGTTQVAMNRWRDYMVSMGFGYPLGIDIPGEKRGMIPNAEYYDKHYRGSWKGATVISIAIGQGEVTATPLQIANLAATIANRGWYITPHVVREVQGVAMRPEYTEKHRTLVDRRHYETVVQGMRSAVTGGTCRAANTALYEVCGKTGTAQNRGQDHSVFMGFAPMDAPQIAVAVYVENGGWGATYGVPIGALMMEQYIKGRLSPESEERAEEFAQKTISYGNAQR